MLEKLHGDNQYTLVLLDCEMPDLDGYEVCRRWREHERQHNLPPLKIVALTAHAMDEVKALCLSCGMDDVIHKPVSKKTLIQVLNHYKPASPAVANRSFADTSSKLP